MIRLRTKPVPNGQMYDTGDVFSLFEISGNIKVPSSISNSFNEIVKSHENKD